MTHEYTLESKRTNEKMTLHILNLGRGFPGEGNGTPLQYSCLENPMDGGAWWTAVHEVAKSRTRLKQLHFYFSLSCIGEGNDNPLQCSCLENPRDCGEPGGLPSMGSHRIGHDWRDLAAAGAFQHTNATITNRQLAHFNRKKLNS